MSGIPLPPPSFFESGLQILLLIFFALVFFHFLIYLLLKKFLPKYVIIVSLPFLIFYIAYFIVTYGAASWFLSIYPVVGLIILITTYETYVVNQKDRILRLVKLSGILVFTMFVALYIQYTVGVTSKNESNIPSTSCNGEVCVMR